VEDCIYWQVDNNVASHRLDGTHILHVSRQKEGISLRVVEDDVKLIKPRVIFTKFISNDQLGYFYPQEE
jgi:hypothetical protein